MKKPLFSVTISNVGEIIREAGKFKAYAEFKESCEAVNRDSSRFSGETVTLWKDGEPIKEYQPSFYFVELTDTYGGEANYSFVYRFKVRANSAKHAITKMKKYRYNSPMPKHQTTDYGDTLRIDFRHACLCAFVSHWQSEYHAHYSHIIEL